MEIRTQYIIIHRLDETTETTEILHIYAPHGHFEEGGWHIELGIGAQPTDFHEVEDPGMTHEVPDTLPEIEIWEEEPDDDTPATIEDYERAFEEIAGGEDE